jgi:hypothetical protein
MRAKRRYISALLDNESPGLFAEFFALVTEFTDRDAAARVLAQSFPLLLRLARKVPDEPFYAEIVAGCIKRHLGATGPRTKA